MTGVVNMPYIEDLNITPSLSLTTPLLQIEDKYCHVNKTTCWLYPEKWFFFSKCIIQTNQFLSVVVYINSLSQFKQFVIRILFESRQKKPQTFYLYKFLFPWYVENCSESSNSFLCYSCNKSHYQWMFNIKIPFSQYR